MVPFETYDAPETGHTVKGNFEFLDNFKRETLKHPSPPGNVRERLGVKDIVFGANPKMARKQLENS